MQIVGEALIVVTKGFSQLAFQWLQIQKISCIARLFVSVLFFEFFRLVRKMVILPVTVEYFCDPIVESPRFIDAGLLSVWSAGFVQSGLQRFTHAEDLHPVKLHVVVKDVFEHLDPQQGNLECG